MKGEVVGVVPTLGLAAFVFVSVAENEDEIVAVDLHEGIVVAVEVVGAAFQDFVGEGEAFEIGRAVEVELAAVASHRGESPVAVGDGIVADAELGIAAREIHEVGGGVEGGPRGRAVDHFGCPPFFAFREIDELALAGAEGVAFVELWKGHPCGDGPALGIGKVGPGIDTEETGTPFSFRLNLKGSHESTLVRDHAGGGGITTVASGDQEGKVDGLPPGFSLIGGLIKRGGPFGVGGVAIEPGFTEEVELSLMREEALKAEFEIGIGDEFPSTTFIGGTKGRAMAAHAAVGEVVAIGKNDEGGIEDRLRAAVVGFAHDNRAGNGEWIGKGELAWSTVNNEGEFVGRGQVQPLVGLGVRVAVAVVSGAFRLKDAGGALPVAVLEGGVGDADEKIAGGVGFDAGQGIVLALVVGEDGNGRVGCGLQRVCQVGDDVGAVAVGGKLGTGSGGIERSADFERADIDAATFHADLDLRGKWQGEKKKEESLHDCWAASRR